MTKRDRNEHVSADATPLDRCPFAVRFPLAADLPDAPAAALNRFAHDVRTATDAGATMAALQSLAAYLTQRVVIEACDVHSNAIMNRWMICEVELYARRADTHDDAFTHADPLQYTSGGWYFHRKGGTFKGGSFKGVDITAGCAECPVGALIRSVCAAPTDAAACGTIDGLVDGPCLVVDAMLKAMGVAAIKDAVSPADGSLPVDAAHLSLVAAPPDVASAVAAAGLLAAPRVGLIPRTADAIDFAARLLRFVVVPAGRYMKHKGGIVAGALTVVPCAVTAPGTSAATPLSAEAVITALRRVTNAPLATIAAAVAAFEAAVAAGRGDVDASLLGSKQLNTAAGAAALVGVARRTGVPHNAA